MTPAEIILIVVVTVVSVALHEAAHGYAALWLGDPTAKLAGRLSVNPLRHVDPLGSVIVPGLLALSGSPVLFGWAKPVPYNPYNLRNRRWGEALVAAAGPLSNVALAACFALAFRLGGAALPAGLPALCELAVLVNLSLAAFNMMPVPPLDGSKILAAFMGQRGRALLELPITASLALIFLLSYAVWPAVERLVLHVASVALGG